MTKIFGQIDTGELAARLGSPVTFDRRGNVIWYDDFEGDTLLWEVTGESVGSSAVLDNSWAVKGSQCAKITVGAALPRTETMFRTIPIPQFGKIGYEIALTFDPDIKYISLIYSYYDGTDVYNPYIRIDNTNDKLQYFDIDTGYTDFDDLPTLKDDTKLFNYFKIVADLATGKYIRLIINENVWDMSAYSFDVTGSLGTAPHLYFGVGLISDTAAVYFLRADNVIITQNEP